jgi:hypothetical protein
MKGMALSLVAVLACDKSDGQKVPDLPVPAAATDGRPGMIRPTVTPGGVTLAAGVKAWWFELDFACYLAGVTMNGTTRAIEPIENVRPGTGAILTAAGFDFDKDLLSVGAMDCGEGLCLHFGVKVKDAAQIRALMTGLFGPDVQQPEPDHYRASIQGPAGERAIHLRFLPIDWDQLALPADPRAERLRAATHLVFMTADAASAAVPDPFSLVAAPSAVQSRLAAIEALAPDRRGRCAIGEVPAASGFRPGFDLTGGRFIVVTPPRAPDDALASMVGTARSLDLEIQFDLSKTPTAADVDGWIEQGRQYFNGIAAGTPAPPALVDLMRLVVEKALSYKIGDKQLVLSWHTARVPRSALESAETALQELMPR